MKPLKIVVAIALILAVLLIAGFTVAVLRIDAIAKAGIERGGTYALGVNTELDSADVGILSGTFSMKGLTVANPAGFDRPTFLDLGDGGVAVQLSTLTQDVVRLPTLELRNIGVDLLRNAEGARNYQVILDNLKRLESGTPPADQPKAEPGKKFVIDRVLIQNVKVHIDLAPIGGELTKLDVTVPTIELTGLGSDGADPMELAEVTSTIVKAILTAVAQNAQGVLPADLLNDLTGQLAQLESLSQLGVNLKSAGISQVQDLVEQSQQAIQDLTQQGRDIADQAQGAVDDAKKQLDGAKDTIDNLLNRPKKNEQDNNSGG